MLKEEKNLENETISDTESFAEKLKNADSFTGREVSKKSELEALIKRNQEMVQKSEIALEGAEKTIETVNPLKTIESDKKSEDNKVSEKEQQVRVKFHAKDIVLLEDSEEQISKIVELASEKNPHFAIKVARYIDSNYVLDKVRDQLAESRVRDVLIKKGLLEDLK